MNFLKDIIKLDKRKGIMGILLAVLVMVVCCLRLKWYVGLLYAFLFLGVGYVRLDIKNKNLAMALNLLWAVAAAVVSWFGSIAMVNAADTMNIGFGRILLNIIGIFILYGTVYILSANWKLSVVIVTVFLFALTTSNGFIFQFRGKELGPMDILSAKTALSVAGQYDAKITPDMVYGWFNWMLIIFICAAMPKMPKLSAKKVRLFTILAELILIPVFVLCSSGIIIKTWEKQGTEANGYFLNFYISIRDSIIEKPENYNPETVEVYAQDNNANSVSENKELPNVIVIMNESFVDFSVLGNEIRTNQPVTPFLDGLTENTIRGYALSSVYGGNTANSEFEFLTGHSMAFLPDSSVPYQQYIRDNIHSLMWFLDSYGYKNISTHPYHANGWSRNKIYPYLGFEESTFLDSYKGAEYVRCYVSDKAVYDYMLNNLNNKTMNERLFIFGITMQNHGGYIYDEPGFTQTIELEGYNAEYPKTEQYLSLVHESDSAIEYFLGELEKLEQDTVVLFFGDHYPDLEKNFYREVKQGEFDKLNEKMLQYTIPFFIWANYDIEEQTIEQTSINYLARHLLDAAGIELSPYYKFLKKMEENVPSINAHGYFSKSKNDFIPLEESEGNEKEWLNMYSMMQYNNMHDLKHRSRDMFEKYITVGETAE